MRTFMIHVKMHQQLELKKGVKSSLVQKSDSL